jgi:hypothetical protein
MNWKFTDASHTVAARMLEGGAMESCLAAALPEGTQVLPPDPPDFKTPLLDDFKARREIYLNRLGGIAGRSARAGDTAIAQAADTFAQGLLDLPDQPDVVAASWVDGETYKDAIMAEYKRLAYAAASTSGAVAVFDKVSK